MEHTYLQAVNSRVLLGSTLGHILFNISSTNSLEEMMDNISIKFAAAPVVPTGSWFRGNKTFHSNEKCEDEWQGPSNQAKEVQSGCRGKLPPSGLGCLRKVCWPCTQSFQTCSALSTPPGLSVEWLLWLGCGYPKHLARSSCLWLCFCNFCWDFQ